MQSVGFEERDETNGKSVQTTCDTEARKGDNRGQHWKSKVAVGNAPEPWKHTKDWADRRNKLEAEFDSFCASRDIKCILPWRRPSSTQRVMGNTNKVLYIELITHYFKKTAILNFDDNESLGFLGIKGVFVSAENRAVFDGGLITSVDAKRRVESHWPNGEFRRAGPEPSE